MTEQQQIIAATIIISIIDQVMGLYLCIKVRMISFKQERRYMKSSNNEQVNHLRSFLACKTKAIQLALHYFQMDKLPITNVLLEFLPRGMRNETFFSVVMHTLNVKVIFIVYRIWFQMKRLFQLIYYSCFELL